MASTGPAPFKVLTSNNPSGVDQRSSSWVIAVSRYSEPASGYDPQKDPAAQQQLQIIENDAIGVSISCPKNSFGKTASIRLKPTNVWYPSLVNNGDWICIWMHSDRSQTERISSLLKTIQQGGSVGTQLCDANSGLKFVGRITSINHQDTLGSNGKRSLMQTINAQMFLELATSIYYIFKSPVALAPTPPPSERTGGSLASLAAQAVQGLIENYQINNGLDASLTDLAQKFLDYYKSGKPGSFAPDNIVALFFIIIMGIDSDAQTGVFGVKGTVNDGITQTKDISKILGRGRAKKLWELYNVYLGLQKYQKSGEWWQQFNPIVENGDVLKRTPKRTKGFVPFTPTMWDNVSMWDILNRYVNPICNELYTCLRIDENGLIRPTLVHREKPFSTGLFNYLTRGGKIDPNLKIRKKSDTDQASFGDTGGLGLGDLGGSVDTKGIADTVSKLTKPFGKEEGGLGGNADRTLYASLPRWVVDESIIRSFSYSLDESQRINFVQVWGRNSGAEFTGINVKPETIKQSQLAAINYYTDEVDVARHGLRARILETNFDVYTADDASGSLAPLWAKMNADWAFNGHLRANANLTVNGVVEPVCEGDNLQIRGLVFHIDSVSHNANLGPNGKKTWTTSFSLSRGMLADSLSKPSKPPMYITHGAVRSYKETQDNDNSPGYTWVQERVTGEAASNVDEAKKLFKSAKDLLGG